MTGQASFQLRGRNPDVLTCIANLSSDEVFTPPELANRMLDTLGAAWAEANGGSSIWRDSSVTFLDPCTKSGVFLREIAKRLIDGLADEFPDLNQRVDHILEKQVFGMGITTLTSFLARRSLYCSKQANGEHSIAKVFDEPGGKIWFGRTEHTWLNGKCTKCSAPRSLFDRPAEIENHAYPFLHLSGAEIYDIFGADMQFDVIIGNPPYQLGSDGGTRDVPIYQKFVQQAKCLSPKFISMIIPSRWMATGLGLTEFRSEMLHDRRIKSLFDFPVSKEVFSGVEVKGGVCYFLWDSQFDGDCDVTLVRGDVELGPVKRSLSEFDVLVRDSRALSILRKVAGEDHKSIKSILSADKEFGWTSNFDEFRGKPRDGDVPLYYVRRGKRDVGYVSRNQVVKSASLIDSWKVLIPSAGSDASTVPDYVLSSPVIAPAPSVCTQTYLFFLAGSEFEAESIVSYLRTKFVRFLISLRKITQHATRSTYEWVPLQDWNESWTDEKLFDKYGLSEPEREYIAAQIRSVSW